MKYSIEALSTKIIVSCSPSVYTVHMKKMYNKQKKGEPRRVFSLEVGAFKEVRVEELQVSVDTMNTVANSGCYVQAQAHIYISLTLDTYPIPL